jgi:hypothetical protein
MDFDDAELGSSIETFGGLQPTDTRRLGDASIDRRGLLRAGGCGIALLLGGQLLRKPLGSVVEALAPRSISTAASVEVQMFQTAASLENLTIAAYGSASEQAFVQGDAVMARFVETTLQQHAEHAAVFNDHAEMLGGERQDSPNPRYSEFVERSLPTIGDLPAFVVLAGFLEQVVTHTYLSNLTVLRDPTRRIVMASVMGVESQHLAMLRTFGALVAADAAELVAIPTDPWRLPPTIGAAALPQALEVPHFVSPPAEGAVR